MAPKGPKILPQDAYLTAVAATNAVRKQQAAAIKQRDKLATAHRDATAEVERLGYLVNDLQARENAARKVFTECTLQ